MPGRRKWPPIRSSRPIAWATTPTSAPTSSQTFAISLMNEIFVARNAFEASLIISADATSARTSSPPSASRRPRTAVGGPQLPAERLVQLLDGVADPLVARVGTDDDAVGVKEVVDRRALL